MSHPPPYGPVPSGYPPGYPQRPVKYRPSGWWFAVGGGLIVVAVVVAVIAFVWALSAFLHTDAVVRADGETHRVEVSTDGDRMLWMDHDQSCEIVDAATGETIALRPVSGSFERLESGEDLEGMYKFDPGSGDLTVTCTTTALGQSGNVLIGPMPHIASFVIGILVAIFVPAGLGLAGLVILIVTGVLFTTRQPRPKS